MAKLSLQPPIKNLHLLARQVVEGFLIGWHKSPFHGFSVEFAEHRLYNQGDNLKHVDWKVFGRNDKMFVKKFEEETNLRCCLALDTSSSMYFRDGGGLSKMEFACVVAASISYLLTKQMDASALALFDEKLQYLMPARSGAKQHQLIVNELERLLAKDEARRATDFPKSIHELAERLHQRSLVVIFSDVPENPERADEFLSALQHLKYNKHEVLLFHILEGQKEVDFSYDNRPYTFEDMETGTLLRLNPEEYKETFLKEINRYREFIKDECLKHRIDYVYCDLKTPPGEILANYLAKRNKMM